MGEEDTFLRAIIADPDDDGLRLIYADWLEEQGDPRGELVRLQCWLTNLAVRDGRRPALEERARRLAAEYGDPLACLPQKSELIARGWVRRVIRLTGKIRATVEYNGRGFGYDSARVNGKVVRRHVQCKGLSQIEFPLPGPLGLIDARFIAYWETEWTLDALRLYAGDDLLYTEGNWRNYTAELARLAVGPRPTH
jgi:uncharacterized protein (TIGR02996 family)